MSSHNTVTMKQLRAVFMMFCLLRFAIALTCLPSGRERTDRATKICDDPKIYHCLRNASGAGFVELCKQPVQFVRGTYPEATVDGYGIPRVNAADCPDDRFQNISYSTNQPGLDLCPYIKTVCHENGQRTILSNKTWQDNSCICYKGYMFIMKPEKTANSCKEITLSQTTVSYDNTESNSDEWKTALPVCISVTAFLIILFVGCCCHRRIFDTCKNWYNCCNVINDKNGYGQVERGGDVTEDNHSIILHTQSSLMNIGYICLPEASQDSKDVVEVHRSIRCVIDDQDDLLIPRSPGTSPIRREIFNENV